MVLDKRGPTQQYQYFSSLEAFLIGGEVRNGPII
jgi:hypothetical protein